MEQLGSYRADFHEILHCIIFLKSVEDIQVSLKYDKNSGYFTLRLFRFIIRSRGIHEHLGSKRANFHEILHFIIFRKFVEEIQVSLKYEKNSGYFTWRLCRFIIRSRGIHGTTRLQTGGFSWNFTLYYFSKICQGDSSFTKIWQEQRVLYVKTM